MNTPQIFTRAASWFAKTFFRPRWGARRALGAFLNQGTSWGQFSNSWTDNRYEQVKHFKNWVYVAVDRIATEIAMHTPNVSLMAQAGQLDVSMRRMSPYARSKALTPLRSHEELSPAPYNHPLCRLLRDPNEPDTAFDLWYESVLFLLLTGNCYWWVPPNAVGLPAAIWVLPAHWVWAHHNKQGHIDRYELRPVEGNYVRAYLPAEDVIHFRRKSPVSKIDGYSPQSAAAQWVDCEESISRSQWFSFRNGIFPGVSVEFDPQVKLPDEDDLDRIEARLMARYGGEWNNNRPILVPPGAKVRKLQLTNSEMQFLESEQQLRDQVLACFNVPAVVAGVCKDLTYGGGTAARIQFYAGAVNPLFRFFGEAVTTNFAVPRFDRRLRVWWEDKTPQDPELLEKTLMTDLAFGSRTMNEVRGLRGLEPYPQNWADEPWLQMNTKPVSLLLSPGVGDEGSGARGGNRSTLTSPENTPNLSDENEHVGL